ncbi:NACHT domain-containing protein [Streptomyces sp. NPDC057702]|uniref:NACHT domain-containing protein n=1 Tax=unclassified Streptomyces TaxID=2593676 RepID=UPI0036CBA6F0
MEPTVIGTRLASSAIAPLVRKLFVSEGPGAGLVDKPVRISGLVSFRGEKRTLTETDLHKLAAELVRRGIRAAGPGERPIPADEQEAVTHALTRTLHGLGDLTLSDVDAVRHGSGGLARRLVAQRPDAGRAHGLSADATAFHDTVLEAACLHILHFFTQRSSFVAHTLVRQSEQLSELVTRVDALIERTPTHAAADVRFEERYARYVTARHGTLTIYGIDLTTSPDRWPLDATYLSLRATRAATPRHQGISHPPSHRLDPDEVNPEDEPDEPYATALPLPADQALADRDRVLVRGVAGSGKTTLVQWLAVVAASRRYDERLVHLYGRVPFVLPLRTLTRGGARLPTPGAFLAAVGCPITDAQPEGWADRVLGEGRGLVLVDGIDEIPEAERARARRWLRDLLDAYPGNLYLVTSRPSAVREDWLGQDGFDELTLAPMSREDVAAFIGRWHTAARSGATGEAATRLDAYEHSLLTAVRTQRDLGRLATNPLMCGLICALHRDRRGYLPHGRKELYDAALSMLLTRRDRERDMSGPDGVELPEEPQVQLLQRLAYWLIRNGRTELDRDHAERVIAQALPAVPAAAAQGDGAAIFRHLLLRSGLLREPGPGAVDFVHRTFQDYLGARRAVEEWDIGLLIDHAGDDQWEDVIRMAVAHARPRERAELLGELIRAGDQAGDAATRMRVHLLALACLEHATEIDPAVRAEVEERTARLIPPATNDAARLLAAIGPLVLGLLPGPENLSEREATRVTVTASHIDSDAAIPALARFRDHPAISVRSQLVWAWHRYDTRRYAHEVIAHLDPEGLYYVATSAEELAALAELGGRPRLETRGDIDPAALAAYVGGHQLTHLRMRGNDLLEDLNFLSGQGELTSLGIQLCGPVHDLGPISSLPLEHLALTLTPPPGAEMDLSPLRTLTRLRSLRLLVDDDLTWDLGRLPVEAPLSVLELGYLPRARGGMEGVSRWPLLGALELGVNSPQSSAEWDALCTLGHLDYLSITGDSLTHLTPRHTLPTLPRLRVDFSFEDAPDLTALPTSFPGLRWLDLSDEVDTNAELDLTPLADLTQLTTLHVPPDARLTGPRPLDIITANRLGPDVLPPRHSS